MSKVKRQHREHSALTKRVVRELTKKHGAKTRQDIVRGVEACARVWDFGSARRRNGRGSSRGDAAAEQFEQFCLAQYVPPGRERRQLILRLDEFHHAVAGSLGMAEKVTRAGQDIADRPLLAAEDILAAFAPDQHLSEDYRRAGIAAIAQLNFGTDDRKPPRRRIDWAARRLGRVGREVVPAKLLAEFANARTDADRFISAYNLHVGRYDFGDARVKFPKSSSLVSHWDLRDTIVQLEGSRHALPKQRALLALMQRVVDGEIPADVLSTPNAEWNIPRGTIRLNGKSRRAQGHGALRWQKFHKVWRVHRKLDPYRHYGNLIDNKFLGARELPEETVVDILTSITASPLAERVAACLRDHLGRDLEPFDVYNKRFARHGKAKTPLGYDVRKRFPTADSLHEAIADILVKLGWRKERARWIQSKIRVDNGRSAGHAWPPAYDTDQQLLRVRVDKRGCDEINFETYMHELGHCVEGVLSSYEMDYKVLWGVPNTAFTEGFAFTFQDRTDQILGRRTRKSLDADTLERFWQPFEIAGAALTEIRLYHWLYAHPEATPTRIMKAARAIGDEVWDEYYARIFGPNGHGLMSVYSHMLWGDFYLAEYPLGYVIAYQVRKHLEGKPLAGEMERMCQLGSIYPQEWMRQAVGQKISAAPLLSDTEAALKRLGY